MHEILESISQRIRRTEVEENRRISKASNVTRRDKRISLVQFREGKTHGTWVGIACITYPQKEVYYTYAYKTIILTAISIV